MEFCCNIASTRATKEGAGKQWFLTPLSVLKAAQDKLIAARQVAMPTAMASRAFGHITTALLRDLYDGRVLDTRTRADRQAQAYRTSKTRMYDVMEQLQQTQDTRRMRRSPVWSRLPMAEVSK